MQERLRFEREVELLTELPTPLLGSVAAAVRPRQPIMTKTCADKMEKVHVAVVGAGLAGLMAALELAKLGAKVTLYEAWPKPGGRVASDKTLAPGRIVERGAELIGSFHTVLLKFAREHRISMITRSSEEDYDRQGLKLKLELRGRQLSNQEYFDVSEKMESKLEEIANHAHSWIADAEEPWNSRRTLSPLQLAFPPRPSAPFLTLDDLDNTTVAHALKHIYNVQPNTDLWEMLEHLLVNDEVAQLEEMNFLGLLCKVKGGQGPRLGRPFKQKPHEDYKRDERQRRMGYWHELEIFRCADGCEAVVNAILADFEKLPGAKWQPNTAVTVIQITADGVLIGSRPVRNEKITEGMPVPAYHDYVVFTVPPTVWSKVSVNAGGILDKEKKKVTGDASTKLATDPNYLMTSGDCIKHFIISEERFWMKHPAVAPYGGTLKLGQVWEGTDNQTRTGPKQRVVLSVFAGPLIPDTLRPGGKGFRVPSKQECTAEVKRLYGTHYPAKAKPEYADWPGTAFIKTGYASPSLGQVLTVGRKLIEKPYHGRLIFAGEHTNMGFFGYMEGALRSGVRAAAAVKRQVCPELEQPPAGRPERLRIA